MMDFLDPKAQKIRNRIYGSIFIAGTIVFFILFMNFLFDSGYDPKAAMRRSGGLGTVSLMAFGLAILSSAMLTLVANILGSIIEIILEPKKEELRREPVLEEKQTPDEQSADPGTYRWQYS